MKEAAISGSYAHRHGGTHAVIHFVEAFGGGVLEVVCELANATAERDIPTVVIFGRRPQTPFDIAQALDRRVGAIEVRGWGTRRGVVAFRSQFIARRALIEACASYAGGVVHLHSSIAGAVGRTTKLRTGSWRMFYSPHAYAFVSPGCNVFTRWFLLALERVLANRATTVAVSNAEASVAGHEVGARRVLLARNGVRLQAPVEPRPRDSKTVRVAALGRAVSQRAPEGFAQLARQVTGEGHVEFIWIGDGPARPALEDAGVRVTGWMAREEATRLLADVDVVVHLALFEGLPLALLDAMAAGKAVIASDIPPIREVVGDVALLVRTPEELSSAVWRLVEDTALRYELGGRARERAVRDFDVRRTLSTMIVAYGYQP